MKKLVFCLTIITSTSAISADWTPAFKFLEDSQNYDDTVISAVMKDTFIADLVDNQGQVKKVTVGNNALQGVYQNVPKPYQMDLLPAIQDKPHTIKATIPLKNASLYGRKLENFVHWSCAECGDVGFTVIFSPMTNRQYQKLKNTVKFEKVDDICGHDVAGTIQKLENGKVALDISMGC